MKLKIVLSILFLSVSMCKIYAQKKNKIDKKACHYVQEQISLVEKFYSLEDGYSLELISASKFLGEISNLESKWLYSCLEEEPTSDIDLKLWKNWYQENKHLLYWDDQIKAVRVKLGKANSFAGLTN